MVVAEYGGRGGTASTPRARTPPSAFRARFTRCRPTGQTQRFLGIEISPYAPYALALTNFEFLTTESPVFTVQVALCTKKMPG